MRRRGHAERRDRNDCRPRSARRVRCRSCALAEHRMRCGPDRMHRACLAEPGLDTRDFERRRPRDGRAGRWRWRRCSETTTRCCPGRLRLQVQGFVRRAYEHHRSSAACSRRSGRAGRPGFRHERRVAPSHPPLDPRLASRGAHRRTVRGGGRGPRGGVLAAGAGSWTDPAIPMTLTLTCHAGPSQRMQQHARRPRSSCSPARRRGDVECVKTARTGGDVDDIADECGTIDAACAAERRCPRPARRGDGCPHRRRG